MSVVSESLVRECGVLAQKAARAILEVYEGEFAVEHKDDRSPLTAADLASHRVIVEGLKALTPDIPILSEESADIAWSIRSAWTRYWLVDPLDGTREFVKRNGEFTVNIALIEDGAPVLGIVQTPVTGELAGAWRGGGTWLSLPHEKAQRVTTRSRGTPVVVASSRSHASEHEVAMLGRVGVYEKKPLGSSLKFVRVAAGEADLYIRLGPTSEWDTAAGQCLVEQAGGAVLDLDGHPLRYNTRDSLINPDFVALGDPAADWSMLFSRP